MVLFDVLFLGKMYDTYDIVKDKVEDNRKIVDHWNWILNLRRNEAQCQFQYYNKEDQENCRNETFNITAFKHHKRDNLQLI